ETTTLNLDLKPGTYKLRLKLDGYDDHEEDLIVKADGTKGTFRYELQKTKVPVPTERTVVINSKPPGASVFLDDKNVGKVTPARLLLKPGTYPLKLTRTGYLDRMETLEVAAGKEDLDVSFDLTPLPAARPYALLAGVREVKGMPSFRF